MISIYLKDSEENEILHIMCKREFHLTQEIGIRVNFRKIVKPETLLELQDGPLGLFKVMSHPLNCYKYGTTSILALISKLRPENGIQYLESV